MATSMGVRHKEGVASQARSNYEAYIKRYREELERNQTGRIALLHDEELISLWNDMDDAYQTGCDKYGLGNFSLQQIGARPVDLGILAPAL